MKLANKVQHYKVVFMTAVVQFSFQFKVDIDEDTINFNFNTNILVVHYQNTFCMYEDKKVNYFVNTMYFLPIGGTLQQQQS